TGVPTSGGHEHSSAHGHSDVAPIDPEEPHSDPQVQDIGETEREDAGTVVGSISGGDDFTGGPGRVRAAPAVRRLARDLGVDLDRLTGTGIAGRITRNDVEAAASAKPLAAKSSSQRVSTRPTLAPVGSNGGTRTSSR